jgi:hypothetical protein
MVENKQFLNTVENKSIDSILTLMPKADIVYFNGRTVKDRNNEEQIKYFSLVDIYKINIVIDFWDEKNKILSLKNKF